MLKRLLYIGLCILVSPQLIAMEMSTSSSDKARVDQSVLEQLKDSVEKNDTQRLSDLLSTNKDVINYNSFRSTWLPWEGGFFSAHSWGGNTLALLAVLYDHIECLRVLIDAQADLSIQRPGDAFSRACNPLQLAAIDGKIECLRELLKADCNPFEGLVGAASRGNRECLELLLEACAQVGYESTNEYLCDALREASYGQIECQRRLLEENIDVDSVDEGHSTALLRAACGATEDKGSNAAVECIKNLLNAGANPDIKGDLPNVREEFFGYTALMWTAMWTAISNRPTAFESMRLLTRAHADLEIKNNQEDTVLMVILKNLYFEDQPGMGKHDFVKELIDAKADVNTRDNKGQTPLIVAARFSLSDCLGLLIEADADLNATDSQEETALMEAASKFYTDREPMCVRDLITANASLDLKNNKGLTALMLAAGQNSYMIHKAGKGSFDTEPKSLRELIKANANLNLKDNEGRNALMFAARWGRTASIKELVDAGAQLSITDDRGFTALQYGLEKLDDEGINYAISLATDFIQPEQEELEAAREWIWTLRMLGKSTHMPPYVLLTLICLDTEFTRYPAKLLLSFLGRKEPTHVDIALYVLLISKDTKEAVADFILDTIEPTVKHLAQQSKEIAKDRRQLFGSVEWRAQFRKRVLSSIQERSVKKIRKIQRPEPAQDPSKKKKMA